MKDIWIIHNSALNGGDYLWQYESFARGVEKNGYRPQLISSAEILPVYGEAAEEMHKPEFALFLDKNLYLAAYLEYHGVRVYNPPESIRICDDKALTCAVLSRAGIPVVPTMIAPKIYFGQTERSVCRQAGERFGYPMIVKEAFGSFGMQVYLAQNEDELYEITGKIGEKPFVFQKFLKEAKGWDVRVIVSGGEVIGAVKRENTQDFRANVAAGGSVFAYALGEQEKELSIKAAGAVGVCFAGVDLLYDGTDFVVCEVNSNLHFKAAQQYVAQDISGKIVNDLLVCCLNK